MWVDVSFWQFFNFHRCHIALCHHILLPVFPMRGCGGPNFSLQYRHLYLENSCHIVWCFTYFGDITSWGCWFRLYCTWSIIYRWLRGILPRIHYDSLPKGYMLPVFLFHTSHYSIARMSQNISKAMTYFRRASMAPFAAKTMNLGVLKVSPKFIKWFQQRIGSFGMLLRSIENILIILR